MFRKIHEVIYLLLEISLQIVIHAVCLVFRSMLNYMAKINIVCFVLFMKKFVLFERWNLNEYVRGESLLVGCVFNVMIKPTVKREYF